MIQHVPLEVTFLSLMIADLDPFLHTSPFFQVNLLKASVLKLLTPIPATILADSDQALRFKEHDHIYTTMSSQYLSLQAPISANQHFMKTCLSLANVPILTYQSHLCAFIQFII